jgi:hypothetical protein
MKKLLVLFLLFVGAVSAAEKDKHFISGGEREKYLKRAQVWHKVDIPAMNIMAGPQSDFAVPFDSEVTCTFEEPKEKPNGVNPKFNCRSESGESIRVKYGSPEVYAEVAATRLFWALGFYADEMYPVRLKCLGCPPNPAEPKNGEERATRIIEDAVIERTFPGIVLESKENEGWNWKEFEEIDEKEGGASRRDRDALKLLATFVQDVDSKPDNQRLACYKEDFRNAGGSGEAFCTKPVVMIEDLGSTFGSGGVASISKMEYKGWKDTTVFNTAEEAKQLVKTDQVFCVGNIVASMGATIGTVDVGLTHPAIGEEGRRFLADLMNQLTDQQIRDLFRVARVDRMDQVEGTDGDQRKITADDWAMEFEKKRAKINEERCAPEPK